MIIYYEPVMNDEHSRRVYINREYFTDLRYESDGAMFTDIQYPNVNLARIFSGAWESSSDETNFYSVSGLVVEIKVL